MGPQGQALPSVASGTLLVHLKADAGVGTDVDGNVVTWLDSSPGSCNFTSLRTAPRLDTSAGGNAVLNFSGSVLASDLPLQLFTAPDSGLTIFTAFSTRNNEGQKFVVNWGIKDPESGNRGNVELGYDTGNGVGSGNFGLHFGCGQATISDPEHRLQHTVCDHEHDRQVHRRRSGQRRHLQEWRAPPPGHRRPGAAVRPTTPAGSTPVNTIQEWRYSISARAMIPAAAPSAAFTTVKSAKSLSSSAPCRMPTGWRWKATWVKRYGQSVTPPPILLDIRRNVVLSFPASAFDYVLEGTDSLREPVQRSLVTEPRVLVGETFQVTIEHIGSQYYQLRQP